MHKAIFAVAALSLTAPAGLVAQELPPAGAGAPPESAPPESAPPEAAPPAPPPSASPAPPAPAAAPGSAAPRIEFVRNPVTQSVPAPRTDDYPICRGDVVDNCINPGAARRAR